MSTASIDPRGFRDALGHYASGITIVAAMVEGAPVGFTCQSFYSVSLDPPLISFSVMKGSRSWQRIRAVANFTVNLLAWDQQHLSRTFSSPSADRWAQVRWSTNTRGGPVIDGCLLWLDCQTYAEHEAGDHAVVIGRVGSLWHSAEPGERSPLVYYRGRYRQLASS
jgi:3-hydroxy-9,10-secoandrosta-1,3,5(10)-triene-9,17-dione monooxygenase reductase component